LILYIISKISQSFTKKTHQFKRFLYPFQDRELTKFQFPYSKSKDATDR